MISQGVIFYNKGLRCLIRLCVAISSLRNVYDGPATVLYEGWVGKDFLEFAGEYDIEIKIIPSTSNKALVRKSQLWRFTPYDRNIYIDADCYIVQNIEGLFQALDDNDFVVHNFSGWKTTGNKISKRIRQWQCVTGRRTVKKAIAYGKAVNTGVFAFRKDAKILEEWEKLTISGYEKNCTTIMVDELACQMLLHKYDHKMMDPTWGVSPVFGNSYNPKIIHYHGSKHVADKPLCKFFKDRYNILKRHYPWMKNSFGDRRLNNYNSQSEKPVGDMTIVTAVNPEYLEKFKKNFSQWMKTKGIYDKKIIVFVNRIRPNDARLNFLKVETNVQLIKWQFPAAGKNVRERMLSAFVFGVADHVKTPYWMKLDGDCTPKLDEFIFPDYKKYDLVGHKWGYTKVKGDPEPRHWLNRLDEWWEKKGFGTIGLNGDTRYPEITGKRYSHPRICTFCAIEKTEHTKELAKFAGDFLPVPSQDTYSWYCADRMGKNILKTNMKKYFSP